MEVTPLTIEPPRSVQEVVDCYFYLLGSLADLETELLATRENAELIAEDILIPAWERHDPIFVARFHDCIVGATFTTLPVPRYHYRVKYATGHGTWVAPQLRGKGIASRLHAAVRAELIALGVQRHIGVIHTGNDASMKAFRRLGFHPYAVLVKYDFPP